MAQTLVEIRRVFGSVSLTDTAAQTFSLDAVKKKPNNEKILHVLPFNNLLIPFQ